MKHLDQDHSLIAWVEGGAEQVGWLLALAWSDLNDVSVSAKTGELNFLLL